MFDFRKVFITGLIALCFLFTQGVYANEEIKFVSVSWTGVTVKTELGVAALQSLGYEASNTMVSVPIAYKALETGDGDIFLGYWYPSMTNIAQKYFDRKTVVNFVANMPGAKYTLAVPTYVAEGGLKDFSDIAKFKDKLDSKIYGIEEGNDGNLVIQDMIDKNMFNLKGFEMIPSSEAGMLSQVRSYTKDKKWIVFLGWSPHYMNEIIDMTYLTGSTSDTFGDNNGTATVYTNIRKGFDKEQPNIAVFLKNYKFPIPMMNQIMDMLNKNQNLTPREAGLDWIKNHPEVYEPWFDGVKTIDGKDGLKAFKNYLKKL
ncbi:MAG: ABC transporter substrate-binding protein [Desulfobacteraceae bacterium]|nr:ABC transporter substrate-binding protein [Desulfobacteraceae bacterium]